MFAQHFASAVKLSGWRVGALAVAGLLFGGGAADAGYLATQYSFTDNFDGVKADPNIDGSTFNLTVYNYSINDYSQADAVGNRTELTNQIRVRLTVASGLGAIHELYVQDGTLFQLNATFHQSAGVDFKSGVPDPLNPQNPPGGSPQDWVATQMFSVQATSEGSGGTNDNSVSVGEYLDLIFTLKGTHTYASTVAMIDSTYVREHDGDPLNDSWNKQGNTLTELQPGLRFAIHVGGLTNDASDTFGNGGPGTPIPQLPLNPVPAPPAIVLAGLGAICIGGFARLRRRFAAAA